MAMLTELPVKTIDGQPSSLAAFAGKVLLIVNVASECGFTPQYQGLENVYSKYRDRGFEVLGFPANDFGAQEPGSNAEIASFCSTTYGVTFPMFEKVVATGPQKHPLFAELIAAAPHAQSDGDRFRKGIEDFASSNGLPAPTQPPEILWNFEKFLIGRDGKVLGRYGTEIPPDDTRLTEVIEKALAS